MIDLQKIQEQDRAILVGVCQRGQSFEQSKEQLDELAFLAETAGALPVRSFLQNLDKPHASTYVGSGKLQEIKVALEEAEANLVIFDDDLSPSQVKNIDAVLNVRVIDRSFLILHIFSERAQTAQARLQVQLAQYQYMLPRLAGLWTHLSKQRGGIGLKGAGEKEIETDRRIVRDKIAQYKKDLEKIERQGANRRKNRGEFVRVALVGYTNVGKSTLMNLISKSQVKAEDKLFATLDTTVRRVFFNAMPFLLSDTVGFIRKLPHHLIESFHSTLAEARESDILLHIVDASHPRFEDHLRVVKETLREVEITGKRIITVFNKVDTLSPAEAEALKKSYYGAENRPAVFVSAHTGEGIDELRKTLAEAVADEYRERNYNNQYYFLEDPLLYQPVFDPEDFQPDDEAEQPTDVDPESGAAETPSEDNSVLDETDQDVVERERLHE